MPVDGPLTPVGEGNGKAPNDASRALRTAFERLVTAQRKDPFPAIEQRREHLERLVRMVREAQGEVESAIDADFGARSRHESRLGEIWITVSQLSHLLRHFERWVEPSPRRVPLPFWFGRAEVRAQPKGVVGIISPWNYPFMLAVQQLGGALAAGNRVLLKLSEHTPRTSQLLASELRKRFSDDVVSVFTGGADEGAALCDLPLDHLLFTGSHDVGKKVYAAAARNLVPVTLELSGKSPALLHDSYSVRRYAESVLSGKCFSSGQTCVAPDYALVPKARVAAVVAAMRTAFAARFPSLRDNPDYSSLASPARRDRILELRRDAESRGASAVELNPRSESFEGTSKLPLTLLLDVPADARVLHEEVFGPLLPVVSYESLGDAIDYINERPRPLALYYFDDEPNRVDRVLKETCAGGVTINETLLHFITDELPRGTAGASGLGAYHGRASFDAFSHQKSVFHQSRLSGVGLLMPPYGKTVDWIARTLIRRS